MKRLLIIICSLTVIACITQDKRMAWVEVNPKLQFVNDSTKVQEVTLSILEDGKYELVIRDNRRNDYSYMRQNFVIRSGQYQTNDSNYILKSYYKEPEKPIKFAKLPPTMFPPNDSAKNIFIAFVNESGMQLYKKEKLIPYRLEGKNLIASRLDPYANQTIDSSHFLYYNSSELNSAMPEYIIDNKHLPTSIYIINNYTNDTIDSTLVTKDFCYYAYITGLPKFCFETCYYQTYPNKLTLKKVGEEEYEIDSLWDFQTSTFWKDTLKLTIAQQITFTRNNYEKALDIWYRKRK